MPENNNKEPTIEIEDPEGYRTEDETYSHATLVMTAMKNCIKNGSKEMRLGYFNEKKDKDGNLTLTYVEDTCESFVESIKTCEMVMACDVDDDAEKNINNLKQQLTDMRKKYLEMEKEEWEKLPHQMKNQRKAMGMQYRPGFFSRELPYHEMFAKMSVEIHRLIYKELVKLTQRLDFYKEETWIG